MTQPTPTPEQDRFYAEFTAWCRRVGISEHKAGRALANDSKLAARIRAGSITFKTANTLRARMAELEAKAPAR
jgi:hypothetical protein